jgi:hypothetical protein
MGLPMTTESAGAWIVISREATVRTTRVEPTQSLARPALGLLELITSR